MSESYKWAMFERFDFMMPNQAVIDCHHTGVCDADVEFWHESDQIDLSHISDEDLAAELREYGAWGDGDLASRYVNEQRIIWIAAGNIQENDRESE